MINTIIFDIGNVLMRFDYLPYVRDLLKDEHVRDKVNGAIWRSGYWNELDKGEDTDRILSLMMAAEPQYAEQIRFTFENVGKCMHKAEYAIPWIKELKDQGYRVLYLSNYSEHTMQANPDVLDFLPFMDGGVFSCHVHLVKPDKRIFQKICDDYSLVPEECVFIDDNYENICAAQEFGLNSVHFTDYSEAKKKVSEYLLQGR